MSGPDPVPLSRAVKMLGKKSVPVPYTLGKFMVKRLFALRLTSFPDPELDHIRFVCMVDGQRARAELGFSHHHGLEETLHAIQAETFS